MVAVHRNSGIASQCRRLLLGCLAIVGLLIGGCLEGYLVGVPIWTDETVVFYPDLVGQYLLEKDVYQLTADKNKAYTVSRYNDGVPGGEFLKLRFVKLGEFVFSSALFTDKVATDEFPAELGLPQCVSRVSFNGKDVTFWTLPFTPRAFNTNEERGKAENAVLLDHVEMRTKEVVVRDAKTGESKKERTVDMSTSELQSFLKKHGAEFTKRGSTYKWIGPIR